MPLAWEQKKRLARLTGIVVDLAHVPEAGGTLDDRQAVSEYLDTIEQEISGTFAPGSATLTEFGRLFGKKTSIPPQTRAAALGGWLKEVLNADQYEAEVALQSMPPEGSRKVSLGFKLRSPVVREPPDVEND